MHIDDLHGCVDDTRDEAEITRRLVEAVALRQGIKLERIPSPDGGRPVTVIKELGFFTRNRQRLETAGAFVTLLLAAPFLAGLVRAIWSYLITVKP